MKISTCLAVALLSLSSMSLYAQEADSELQGELKFENVTVAGGYAQMSTPMAITSENKIVVTGTTANRLTGVLGSYIVMSSKELSSEPLWKIDIANSNIITSIVADADGGVYVGGNFQKTMSLPGVNGTIELSGNTTDDKKSAFLAHINKEGKVVAAQSFVADVNEELRGEYHTEESTICNLSQLAFANGKLYAGLTFTDVLKNADGSKQLMASVGAFYGSKFTSKSYTIAQIDLDNMSITDFPVVFGGKEDTAEDYQGFDAGPTRFLIDGDNLYLAAQTAGYTPVACLWINGEFKDSKEYHYEAGVINGYYLAKIDLASNSLVASKGYDGVYSYQSGSSERAINSLDLVDGNLVMAGSFIQKCPLNTSIEAVGNSDLFVATLDKNDLTVKNVLASKYDETADGANKNDFETFSAYGIYGNELSICGGIGENGYNGVTYKTPLQFTAEDYTAADAAFDENEAEPTDEYITGILTTGGVVTLAFVSNDQTSYYYGYASDSETAVKNIEAVKTTKDDVIYNLQGMKLAAPQKGLNIINGKKVVVK